MTNADVLKALRDRAFANYKAAMEDCQVPTGPLSAMNQMEFYAYTLEQRAKARPTPVMRADPLADAVSTLNRLRYRGSSDWKICDLDSVRSWDVPSVNLSRATVLEVADYLLADEEIRAVQRS